MGANHGASVSRSSRGEVTALAKGINIDIASDTRDFDRGIRKGVIDPLEDAEKAIEELGDAAKKSGDDLEKSFKDAQDETEELAQDYDKLKDAMTRAGKQGGDSFRQSTSDSMSAAKRDMAEVKDEALQNASETFSSFDGSMQSFADGIQGTLGGIVSNIGPVGAAIGAAGALGLGLFMAHLEKVEERAQEVRERAGELTEEYIDTGRAGRVSLESLTDAMRDLATETDKEAYKLSDLAGLAREVEGIDIALGAEALAGDSAAIDQQIDKVQELIAARRDELRSSQNYYDETQQFADEMLDSQLKGMEAYLDALEQEKEAQQLALEQYQAWVDAGGELDQQRAESAAEASESIQEALLEQGAAVEDFIDEESGLFDTTAYLAAFEERAQAVRDYQANMSTASQTLNTEALSYIQSLGIEAAPMLQAYINAPLEERQRLEEVWGLLGQTATDSYLYELQNNMPESIEGPAVNVGPVNDWELEQWMRRPRVVHIQTVAHLPRGERGLN